MVIEERKNGVKNPYIATKLKGRQHIISKPFSFEITVSKLY